MSFDGYQLTLSIIVFTLLTVLFTTFIVILVKYYLKLTELGVNDQKIIEEHIEKQAKKTSIVMKIIDKSVLVLSCLVLFVAFIFSVIVSANDGKVCGKLPSMSVVKSGSMSYISKNNEHFNDSSIGGQMQVFDLIFLTELPSEFDLKLYDVVVYENDGNLIIHRIVGIEEPNERHPDKRYFLLQGDANASPDFFPVEYSQMKAIYNGSRVPFVGSFIIFMQSPAGILCILLVAFAVVATPIAEKKINQKKNERLIAIGVIKDEQANKEKEKDFVQTSQETAVAGVGRIGFMRNYESKTFAQKIESGDSLLKERYSAVSSCLKSIDGVRVIRGKKSETYRKGNSGVCKLTVRGKTLNAFLALNPKDYENTKYIFEDASGYKAYAGYPMRLKLTSNRQVKWFVELVNKLAKEQNFSIVESVEQEIKPVLSVSKKRKNLTFKQRLNRATAQTKARFKAINETLLEIEKISVRESKGFVSYRKGLVNVARIAMRGKTLNAYLALNPKDYESTKYIFVDVGNKKSYEKLPMRIKLTSDRQVRWCKELIEEIIKEKGFSKKG